MLENGVILGGVYQIIKEIGQGGTGIIYVANHLHLHKKVVVKKVKDHYVGKINERAEVDILKHLHHTYLPQVYDFLMIGSSVYTVMEYIEGRDLQYYLDHKYHFPEEIVRKWLFQLTEVLEYLHSQRFPILHSDIKPANIMITGSWDVCLIDFNISLDGESVKDVQGLSPWYAAPEQYERAMHIQYGQQDKIVLDGRMDIYSLGAVFYRVMTGRLPVPTEDQSYVLEQMDVPYSDGLKAVVSRMIKPSPARRYASASRLRQELEDISKADPLYRRYGHLQAGIALAWTLCIIAGVLCIYYGNWKHGVQSWQQAYEKLYIAAADENETEIVATGTDMLNSFTYRSYLNKNGEKKAEVLNILGESYFRQERYEEAASYYREAWELEEGESRYCENYIMALIRDKKTDRAASVARSPEAGRVLNQARRNLIEIELAWASDEIQDVQEELGELEESCEQLEDKDTVVNAYLLLADIFKGNEEYENAVLVLEKALEVKSEKNLLRRLGETAYQASQGSQRSVYQNSYLRKAFDSYTMLNQDANPSYEDRLNLALVERAMGSYEASNRTLGEMLPEYSQEYVLPMWMCYNYLDIAAKEKSLDEVRDDLAFRYQDCKHIYDASGKQDEDMEAWIEIMDEMGE